VRIVAGSHRQPRQRPRVLIKGGVFSKDMIESDLKLKRGEQDRYRTTPHPVEFDMYYSR
jgi:glutamine synthetase